MNSFMSACGDALCSNLDGPSINQNPIYISGYCTDSDNDVDVTVAAYDFKLPSQGTQRQLRLKPAAANNIQVGQFALTRSV